MADKKVILEVELIEGNAQSKLDALRTSLQGLDKTHKDYKPTLELITQAERDLSKVQQKRILIEKGLISSSTKVDNSTKKTAKQMKQLSSDTGASTSATLELGRVFSDAPYGIRGVANNIQQLASNLFFMSKKTNEATGKTVGFGGAIGSLLKNLIGPAGILVAFQAGIALLDYFSAGAKEAKASTSDFESSVKSLTKTLEDLYVPESDIVTKIEEYVKLNTKRIGIDKKLKENFKELSDVENSLIDVKANLIKAIESEANGENDLQGEFSSGMAVREGVKTLTEKQLKLEEQQIDLTKTSIELIQEKNKVTLDYESASVGTVKALEKIKSGLLKEQKTLSSAPEKWKEYADKIKKVQAEIDAITGGDKKKLKKTKLIELEDLDVTAENYESELSKLNERLELIDAKSEEDKLIIKKKYHLARLESDHNEHTDKYKQTTTQYRADLELYLNQQVLLGKMSQEDADKRLDIFDINTKTQIRQSNKNFESLRSATKLFYDNQIMDAVFAGQKLAGNGNTQATQDMIDTQNHLKRKADLYASYADKVKQVLSAISDFVSAEFERELIIEENKTNSANKSLNDRLLNENLSKDQRASIQNQIAQNDEKLRVKKEQIARKQFKVEKAFKIGMAIADTASSALKAYASQLSIPTPDAPFRAAAAAKVATAFGLANVAMIARTKFQSSAPSSPANASIGGSDSSSSGRAEPSFNIVGRSNDNILLSAIQSQFDQPLRAYVVARDVTNQQQLDGVISTSAST
tara:strand:+ start:2132 stop:4393 length:2262 start_codon:yes stop_codon:yes gene_type:complete